MGDATSLSRERNLVKDRGDESPARDAASEVGWRVLAENKSGNKCVEALINNQGALHLSVGEPGGMSRRNTSF
jgi:hypothetical protein